MTQPPYLLSIIIALYNNENFIIDCLQSLLPQLENDIEVIIVDDGSTDLSEKKVQNFIKGIDNFKFIHQENHGVAHAKNTGLHNAQGQYVTFLDSDDLISRQYIQTLRPILQSEQYDIIDFNYKKFCTSPPEELTLINVIPQNYAVEAQGIYTLEKVFEKSLWHLVTRIFRRATVHGERLEDGRRYEDVIFTPFQYFKTRRIAHLDCELYFYRDNSQGITRNIKPKDIEDLLFAMEKMLRFVAQHPGDEPLRRLAALMLANCFSEVKSMSKAVYGYYHYAPATLHILRRAADICRNSDVPGKKVRQMRYARVDTFLSKLRGRKPH